jgi:archaemetzincin
MAIHFRVPTQAEGISAIGDVKGLPVSLQHAFRPDTDFEPISSPKPGDWLAEHREAGQTFDAYIASRPNLPDKRRNVIYLQPLGAFIRDRSPDLDLLEAFAKAYFMLAVHSLPSIEVDELDVTSRINPYTGQRQILSQDVLTVLRRKMPADAFCGLAITMEDLYPDPSWNFIFGQASLEGRVGVFSFARYDPAFYGRSHTENFSRLLLWRSFKVLAHEIGHMFFLAHCIYYQCVMNGSNHLAESDARPLSVCPVCLRKLQNAIGFDVLTRYGKLLEFYKKTALENEVVWLSKRLERF